MKYCSVLLLPLILLAGCGGPDPKVAEFDLADLDLMSESGAPIEAAVDDVPENYRVRKGDTLFSIARQFGLEVNALRENNGLASDHITPGMILHLQAPAGEDDVFAMFDDEDFTASDTGADIAVSIPPARVSGAGYQWPVNGSVIERFAPAVGRKGIMIAARPGAAVYAAAEGTVVFRGFFPGLGNMVVIEHPYKYLTLYGYLGTITVRHKQKVAIGQAIGTVGTSGSARQSGLHFRVYVNYSVLENPLRILPEQ